MCVTYLKPREHIEYDDFTSRNLRRRKKKEGRKTVRGWATSTVCPLLSSHSSLLLPVHPYTYTPTPTLLRAQANNGKQSGGPLFVTTALRANVFLPQCEVMATRHFIGKRSEHSCDKKNPHFSVETGWIQMDWSPYQIEGILHDSKANYLIFFGSKAFLNKSLCLSLPTLFSFVGLFTYSPLELRNGVRGALRQG